MWNTKDLIIEYNAMTDSYKVTSCKDKDVKSIVIPKFYDDKKHGLKPVSIIGEKAFYSCIYLESVQLPKFIKTIKKNAFENCVSLKSLELPDTIAKIEENAFKGVSAKIKYNCKKWLEELEVKNISLSH